MKMRRIWTAATVKTFLALIFVFAVRTVSSGRQTPEEDSRVLSASPIFAMDTLDLPAPGEIVSTWGEFNALGSPRVIISDGVKWMHNTSNPETGMRHQDSPWDFGDTIAIDGATIVVAVVPIRTSDGGAPWNSIVDIFYSQFCIGISNQTGRVKVKVTDDLEPVNHWWTAPAETAIPDGEAGVLSMTGRVRAPDRRGTGAGGQLLPTHAGRGRSCL